MFHPSKFTSSITPPRKVFLLGSLVSVWLGVFSVSAELRISDIEAAYGKKYDVVDTIPGRPWVEVQYRYELDNVRIMCNFVSDRCLWIDYYVEGRKTNDEFVNEHLTKLFPDEKWTPKLFHGRKRWLFNQDEDRVTLRAKGFTLHMNEYIKNVLSRRAQWEF